MSANNVQHPGFNGHALDPATEQMTLSASEAQPPPYDAIPVPHRDDQQDFPDATPVVLQLIGFVLLCFLLYNFIRVMTIVERG
ncbi:MAG: hypothetical protein ASARMPREDX12_001787 [Alectoria sarmentosa]|nr:MAG: hypothetical protein ASARMPREDX12_001787 [Alectoria sarmentosa]